MIDSHCHIVGDEFVEDLDAVAARAAAAGVETALVILDASDAAELARVEVVRGAWPGARFATGVHPHHAVRFAEDPEGAAAAVEAAVVTTGACAVGEIGLDYHYDFSPRDVQHQVFRVQIRLANRLGLPVIIHTREATDDTFRILEEEGAFRGVFHCFTGDEAMARRALGIGFHLSYAGILTFPKAGELREAARATPLDRLLSETDAPYLAPVPHRGKRNEPAYVTRVVETLAELHGLETPVMAAAIERNFAVLFAAPGRVR